MTDYSILIQWYQSHAVDITGMSINPSGQSIAGGNLSLVCSATYTTNPPPDNISPPTVHWFFGPNEGPLPFGVVTTPGSGNILQFSPLNQSHAGVYTCQLMGSARLKANTTVFVNGTSDNITLLSVLYLLSSNIPYMT